MSPESAADRSRAGVLVRRTLLAGVLISGASLLLGLAVVLVTGAERPKGPPPPLGSLLKQVARLEGRGLLNFGLIALMITPVLRVLVLALRWTAEYNYRLAAIAFAVLGLLGMSLWYGVG